MENYLENNSNKKLKENHFTCGTYCIINPIHKQRTSYIHQQNHKKMFTVNTLKHKNCGDNPTI